MERIDFLFEKMFAKQISKMANFPEEILMTLIDKKGLLKEKVLSLGLDINESSFIPVIPTGKMKAQAQIAHLVYHSPTNRAISDIYHFFEGFFYNEGRAHDLSRITKTGYLIDVKTLPLSNFLVEEGTPHEQMGSALRRNVEKEGYTSANHVEAFMIACHTNLLPTGSSFCALNFSWDNYEFAKIAHGRDLLYGMWWIQPSIEGKRVVGADHVLVPAYKEFI